jgi:hypothetical protein
MFTRPYYLYVLLFLAVMIAGSVVLKVLGAG